VHLAEDIVSTAFFRALQSADDTVEDFKAWLYAVCRNEYFSYCRRKKRMAQHALVADAAGEEDVLEGILRDESYRALYRAISLLSPERREAILLHYFADQSIRAIAQILQKSEGSVKVLLHRAREELKKILEETP
jgi:RNA polymerase sigma-70 factor (ECF subfamily)